MKILIVANCNGLTIRQHLTAFGKNSVQHYNFLTEPIDRLIELDPSSFDLIIAQDLSSREGFKKHFEILSGLENVVRFPFLRFWGLTPDHSSVKVKIGDNWKVQDNVPCIMISAFKRGLSKESAAELYNPEFINAIGYRSDFEVHRQIFLDLLSEHVRNPEFLFEKWMSSGVFFHTGNHPKSVVIEDVLSGILEDTGLKLPETSLSDFFPDPLLSFGVEPNLNHPDAINLLDNTKHYYKRGQKLYDLNEMVSALYEYARTWDDFKIGAKDLERFDMAYQAWAGKAPEPTTNPYKKKSRCHFWSKAVSSLEMKDILVAEHLTPVISPTTRVATAGSCFAQHVARAMINDGLNYYVTEMPPSDMKEDKAQSLGYGLFSARYGNIYTAKQLLQLVLRSYGKFDPLESFWKTDSGYIDPFRPNIGEVFEDPKSVCEDRKRHFEKVREMFETLDVFVFTLGLTECWFDKRDGAVFPVSPGAVTRHADARNFGFCNQSYNSIKSDIIAFLKELSIINPKAKVIFTVSPVPLIATYSNKDVLTATTYSKSVLRSVSGEIADVFNNVQYFPSYEIITGNFNKGTYYENDLRSVHQDGVAHVMEVFRDKLVTREKLDTPQEKPIQNSPETPKYIEEELKRQDEVICDEELLVKF
nr:GSCFA domain-containing protein [uncultured Cohaesibacter sp.]